LVEAERSLNSILLCHHPKGIFYRSTVCFSGADRLMTEGSQCNPIFRADVALILGAVLEVSFASPTVLRIVFPYLMIRLNS
jgi:hypothetical protein